LTHNSSIIIRFLLGTLGTGQMLHLVGGVMDVLIRLTFNLTKRKKKNSNFVNIWQVTYIKNITNKYSEYRCMLKLNSG